MKKIVILTGAGVSKESGIETFRGSGGTWNNVNIKDVATPQAWKKDRELVNDFYNQRRRDLKAVKPNEAHDLIAKLEENFNVVVITQNVDNLHERAGSTSIIHLHGELAKVRSTLDESLVYDWENDITDADRCEKGSRLRPHIVWFGEAVPMIEAAAAEMVDADIAIIIGTSMQVYPAASLIEFFPNGNPIHYIDPSPTINYELGQTSNLNIIKQYATNGMRQLYKELNG